MGFLYPFMLPLVLLAAVPVLLHLRRRRGRPVEFPAIFFLTLTDRRLARGPRLRNLVLLLLRVAVLALLAVAFAFPTLPGEGGAASRDDGRPDRVALLDLSASMGLDCGRGGSCLEEARRQIARLIDGVPPGGSFVLAVSDPVAGIIVHRGPAESLRALASVAVHHRYQPLATLLSRGLALVPDADRPRTSIVLYTDATRSSGIESLRERLRSEEGRGGFSLRLLSPDGKGANCRWTSTTVHDLPSSGWRIAGSVACLGDKAAGGGIGVRLERPSGPPILGRIEWSGSGSGSVAFDLPRPSGDRPAVLAVSLALDGDRFPADDRRHLLLADPGRLRLLLVNGEPSGSYWRDELFFLRKALGPGGGGGVDNSEAAPGQLAESAGFDDRDAVVLCNVGRLPDGGAEALDRFVQAGGGLIVFAGDGLDEEWYNSRLSRLTGLFLRGTAEPEDSPDRGRPVVDPAHWISSEFAGEAGDTLAGAEFRRLQNGEPVDLSAGISAPIVLADGRPLLVERRHGRGRVVFFLTTADDAWSTLPYQKGYLSLVRRAVQFAAGRESPGTGAGYVAGDLVASEHRGFVPADGSGRAGQTGIFISADGRAAAVVNPEPVESDVTPVVIEAGRAGAAGEGADGTTAGGLWLAVWAVVALAFIGETLLLAATGG